MELQNEKDDDAVAVVGLLVAGMAGTGGAVTITFTDRAAWQAAVVDDQLETLNGITSDVWIQSSWHSTTGPYDVGPFTISSAGTQPIGMTIEALPYYVDYVNIDGSTYLRSDVQGFGSRVSRFQYDAPIYAWGVDAEVYVGPHATEYIFDGIGSFGNTTLTTPSFFGILSTEAFSTIDITGGHATQIGMDNFRWSHTAGGPAVPEPATMLLLGTGLVGLAGFRRKNKKT